MQLRPVDIHLHFLDDLILLDFKKSARCLSPPDITHNDFLHTQCELIETHYVDAIVEQPFGGYPSAVPNYYDYDWDFWVNYSRINRQSKEKVKEWWHKYVVETEDDWAFLSNKVGTDYTCTSDKTGWERLFELRADVQYGYNPNLERSL